MILRKMPLQNAADSGMTGGLCVRSFHIPAQRVPADHLSCWVIQFLADVYLTLIPMKGEEPERILQAVNLMDLKTGSFGQTANIP